MANETFTSELVKEFNALAEEIKRDYGVRMGLVQVWGKRHSYVAGEWDNGFLPPEIIYLDDSYALVSSEWDKIPEEKRTDIVLALRGIGKEKSFR
ncbi:MAG: hypothetical protein N2572_02030 [Syntrophales bacterium]|nr:hypothetical protein [Syntrophales bacterium]